MSIQSGGKVTNCNIIPHLFSLIKLKFKICKYTGGKILQYYFTIVESYPLYISNIMVAPTHGNNQ